MNFKHNNCQVLKKNDKPREVKGGVIVIFFKRSIEALFVLTNQMSKDIKSMFYHAI